MSQQKVQKAVIAAAGFGTRFLPFTKAMPKEMLPLVDKPIIQYIVEELVGAGIKDIIIVTGYHKRSIEDHFDHTSLELRANLKQGGKTELLEQTRQISTLANFAYIRQKAPYGTAGPIYDASHLIGDEPFIYTFADDFLVAKPSRFKQLLSVRAEHGGSVLTCFKRNAEDDYGRYGYISGKEIKPGLIDMDTIVEKPGSADKAPSDLASVSGYLLDPAIFEYLHKQRKTYSGNSGEFDIQSVMQDMIADGHHIYGHEITNGQHYDTGNPAGYLEAVFDFALRRKDVNGQLGEFLREKLK